MKICRLCKSTKSLADFHADKIKSGGYRSECKECTRARGRKYYSQNGKVVRAKNKLWRDANKVSSKEQERDRRARQRINCIEYYSNGSSVCACCGEGNFRFLTIDHINNDGYIHRNSGVSHICSWLIKNGYPEGFQVLCFNCNCGKRVNNGVCPHKTY